jgi:hypothetical protein
LTLAVAIASVVAIVGVALLASGSPGATGPTGSHASAVAYDSPGYPSGGLIVPGTVLIDPTTGLPLGPTFDPLDLFVTPSPAPRRGAQPTDPSYTRDLKRPLPVQSNEWLKLKAAGRIALVDGEIVLLDAGANPLVSPSTGLPVPAKRTLDVSYARWIVEPIGYGTDQKGNRFSDQNYWNLCGSGATAAALYYWQQLTGFPDVTGTQGYFLEPYASEGVSWPAGGPRFVGPDGKAHRKGTFWSGTDRVNGYTAHGRGFIMYLAMASQPATWTAKGMAVFSKANGTPLYPTRGSPRTNIQTALNWEASQHDPVRWTEAYYASVIRPDPTLARDLQAAVMLDVGRDGVPVVVALDTFNLPNWQAGSATPHIRHAVTIVGYDNTARPPTYTYLDTCGRGCNNRGGNQSGQVHVATQAQMVKAIQNQVGSGFVW